MNWNWHLGKSATLDQAPSQPDKKLRALIDQATSELGFKAAELALNLIREPATLPTTIKLPPKLIVRASSNVAPAPERRSTAVRSPRKR